MIAKDFTSLFEGVRYNDAGDLLVDFIHDEAGDFVPLRWKGKMVRHSKARGVSTFYGFKLVKGTDNVDKMSMLKQIKSAPLSNDTIKIVKKAVMGLNTALPLASLDTVITVESSSPLANRIGEEIASRAAPSTQFFPDKVVKAAFSFDRAEIMRTTPAHYTDEARKELADRVEKVVARAGKSGKLEMKRIPPQYRRYLVGGFALDGTDDRRFNNALSGRVLVIDDYRIGGETSVRAHRAVADAAKKGAEVVFFVLFSY